MKDIIEGIKDLLARGGEDTIHVRLTHAQARKFVDLWEDRQHQQAEEAVTHPNSLQPEPELVAYNYRLYSGKIRELIPDLDERDMKWLCNQAGKLYGKLTRWGNNRVRSFRVCRNIETHPSQVAYWAERGKGWGGSEDTTVINPITGNAFVVGFHYG